MLNYIIYNRREETKIGFLFIFKYSSIDFLFAFVNKFFKFLILMGLSTIKVIKYNKEFPNDTISKEYV